MVSRSKSGTGGNRHGFDELGVLSKAATLDLFSARLALQSSRNGSGSTWRVGKGWVKKKDGEIEEDEAKEEDEGRADN